MRTNYKGRKCDVQIDGSDYPDIYVTSGQFHDDGTELTPDQLEWVEDNCQGELMEDYTGTMIDRAMDRMDMER